MKKLSVILLLFIIAVSCKKEIEGCTNPQAANYNIEAEIDNGSCTIKYMGTYVVKESLFVQGIFNEYKVYNLNLELLSTPDSIVFNNMWDYNKSIGATKTEFSFIIPEQDFDQNTKVTGFGTFDFGEITYETTYGDIKHIGTGKKN